MKYDINNYIHPKWRRAEQLMKFGTRLINMTTQREEHLKHI